MNMYLASPHMYGCELRLFDPEQFRDDYDNHGTPDDNFVLMASSPENVVMWAKSCLSIGEYKGMHRHGGWSPFRSGEVLVTNKMRKHVYNYKLDDDHEWDYIASTNGRTILIQPWLHSTNIFINLVPNLYALKCEQESSLPHLMVPQMLYKHITIALAFRLEI